LKDAGEYAFVLVTNELLCFTCIKPNPIALGASIYLESVVLLGGEVVPAFRAFHVVALALCLHRGSLYVRATRLQQLCFLFGKVLFFVSAGFVAHPITPLESDVEVGGVNSASRPGGDDDMPV
jgi:hypothetical protein